MAQLKASLCLTILFLQTLLPGVFLILHCCFKFVCYLVCLGLLASFTSLIFCQETEFVLTKTELFGHIICTTLKLYSRPKRGGSVGRVSDWGSLVSYLPVGFLFLIVPFFVPSILSQIMTLFHSQARVAGVELLHTGSNQFTWVSRALQFFSLSILPFPIPTSPCHPISKTVSSSSPTTTTGVCAPALRSPGTCSLLPTSGLPGWWWLVVYHTYYWWVSGGLHLSHLSFLD